VEHGIDDFGLRIADCGFKIEEIGVRNLRSEVRGQKTEDRRQNFGFRISDIEMLDDFNDFSGFNDLPLTVYGLPFTIYEFRTTVAYWTA
jgi:hypothetical protein